jgi:uncharacterized integral membrane protein
MKYLFMAVSIIISILIVRLANHNLYKHDKYWISGKFPHLPIEAIMLLFIPVVNLIVAFICIVSSLVIRFGFIKRTTAFKNWFTGE